MLLNSASSVAAVPARSGQQLEKSIGQSGWRIYVLHGSGRDTTLITVADSVWYRREELRVHPRIEAEKMHSRTGASLQFSIVLCWFGPSVLPVEDYGVVIQS
eukprot:9481955-Pyramimonas_sp.AAC.2